MVNLKTTNDFSTLITTNSITVSFQGESKTVRKEDTKYKSTLKALKENQWDQVYELLFTEPISEEKLPKNLRIVDGQVFLKVEEDEFKVPTRLNETILYYIENNLPLESLVKFAINLNQNPSCRSVQQLFNFLEKNHFTLTQDGKFIAYKSVRSNFRDCYSGKFDNSVGKVVTMPRNQVDENPDHVCSNGLHVANYHYAHDIYHGEVTLFVEVHPKDVVSVPADHNNAKIRVSEYKVLGISKGEFQEKIYTSPDSEDEYKDDEEDEDECPECGSLL